MATVVPNGLIESQVFIGMFSKAQIDLLMDETNIDNVYRTTVLLLPLSFTLVGFGGSYPNAKVKRSADTHTHTHVRIKVQRGPASTTIPFQAEIDDVVALKVEESC